MSATLVLVALGGAVGALLRVWTTAAVEHVAGARLPWGTLAVNASGSFAIGLAAGLGASGAAGASAWLFACVGILGSYTTVSAFALQAHALVRGRRAGLATAYALLTLTSCLAAVAAGSTLGRTIVA